MNLYLRKLYKILIEKIAAVTAKINAEICVFLSYIIICSTSEVEEPYTETTKQNKYKTTGPALKQTTSIYKITMMTLFTVFF